MLKTRNIDCNVDVLLIFQWWNRESSGIHPVSSIFMFYYWQQFECNLQALQAERRKSFHEMECHRQVAHSSRSCEGELGKKAQVKHLKYSILSMASNMYNYVQLINHVFPYFLSCASCFVFFWLCKLDPADSNSNFETLTPFPLDLLFSHFLSAIFKLPQ